MKLTRHRPTPTVVDTLDHDLRPHLEEITGARAALGGLIAGYEATVLERRAAHRRLRLAYEAADRVLRAATREARSGPYVRWSRLRSQLSTLDTARQLHLMQERDDVAVLPLGGVRALDTGMSGPSIGELQHGRSVEPGTRPAYGLDLDATLAEIAARRNRPAALSPSATASRAAVVPGRQLVHQRAGSAGSTPAQAGTLPTTPDPALRRTTVDADCVIEEAPAVALTAQRAQDRTREAVRQ